MSFPFAIQHKGILISFRRRRFGKIRRQATHLYHVLAGWVFFVLGFFGSAKWEITAATALDNLVSRLGSVIKQQALMI